jgi:isopenicillin N synthase-like dioxygenase
MYLNGNGDEGKFKLSKTGLFIKNRRGEDIRVTHRPCDIAFQIGETMQIQSGGILQATPHSVVVGDDIDPNYGRSTFVLFMEPNRDVKLEIPSGVDYLDVKTSGIYDNVPKLQDRYKKDMTFGEFNDITIKYYYSMNKKN